MAALLVPDLLNAEMTIPVFIFFKPHSPHPHRDIKCNEDIMYVWITTMYFSIKSQKLKYSVQRVKRPGIKSVAIATPKYAPCGVFLRVQYYCQVSYAFPYYLQRFSSFYVLALY